MRPLVSEHTVITVRGVISHNPFMASKLGLAFDDEGNDVGPQRDEVV